MIAQIIAVVIFIAMFALIISEHIERHIVSLLSAAAMIVVVLGICMRSPEAIVETLAVAKMFHEEFWFVAGTEGVDSTGINWSTIIFITCMMIMVEGLGRSGVFRWICLFVAKAVDYKPKAILVMFMIMAAVLAMFIDSITVILFMVVVTIELADLLKFDARYMIIAEIFSANLGGAATMSGDAPNIIIGTTLHFTFFDFFTNTGVISAVALLFALVFFSLAFREKLENPTYIKSTDKSEDVPVKYPQPKEAIKSKRDFAISWCIFITTVVLLVTHGETGLTVVSVGVIVATLTAISSGKRILEIIKGIDYKTILFFLGLFVVVSGLEETGLLVKLAKILQHMGGGSIFITILVIVTMSAMFSAFVDNIPFTATMIPVIKTLAANGAIQIPILAWALSIGAEIGGNATPIGGSANVVGIGIAAKNGHFISWKRYCKYAVPMTLIALTVGLIIMESRYI